MQAQSLKVDETVTFVNDALLTLGAIVLRHRKRQRDVWIAALVSGRVLWLDEGPLRLFEGQVIHLLWLPSRTGLSACVQCRAGAGAKRLSLGLLSGAGFELGRDLLLGGKRDVGRANVLRVCPFGRRSCFILIVSSTTLASKKEER